MCTKIPRGEMIYMIIGLFVFAIGIIPLVLALTVIRNNKGSKLSLGLFLFMIVITIWQADVGILYFKDQLSEEMILFLFRLFRIAPTFAVPLVFYIAYAILKDYLMVRKGEGILGKIVQFIFTKKMFIFLLVCSSIFYLINWTKLGISGLKTEQINYSTIEFYFPEYGPLAWLYIGYLGSIIIFLLFVFLLSGKILNTNINKFLRAFSLYSFLLFISGWINFSPGTGALTSSIVVIFFSILIMFEYMKLNTSITLNYYQLLERQKKLDYTGYLAGSLIHEVKNTNQVIKGFSQLLKNSVSMTEYEKGYVDMILQSSEQMENLAENYKEYMKHAKIECKVENLIEITEKAIDFLKETIKEKHVEIECENDYRPILVFINKTYLQQVFINLIKNSIEAIPLERETKKITIQFHISEESVVIDFYDTGKGIPRENWETIFDPFISFKETGLGLGLPFVKKMIFEHRGDIYIVDSTKEGTHMQIQIPQFEISDGHLLINK